MVITNKKEYLYIIIDFLNIAEHIIDSEDFQKEQFAKIFVENVQMKNSLGIYQLLLKFLDLVSLDNKNFVPIDVLFFSKISLQN